MLNLVLRENFDKSWFLRWFFSAAKSHLEKSTNIDEDYLYYPVLKKVLDRQKRSWLPSFILNYLYRKLFTPSRIYHGADSFRCSLRFVEACIFINTSEEDTRNFFDRIKRLLKAIGRSIHDTNISPFLTNITDTKINDFLRIDDNRFQDYLNFIGCLTKFGIKLSYDEYFFGNYAKFLTVFNKEPELQSNIGKILKLMESITDKGFLESVFKKEIQMHGFGYYDININTQIAKNIVSRLESYKNNASDLVQLTKIKYFMTIEYYDLRRYLFENFESIRDVTLLDLEKFTNLVKDGAYAIEYVSAVSKALEIFTKRGLVQFPYHDSFRYIFIRFVQNSRFAQDFEKRVDEFANFLNEIRVEVDIQHIIFIEKLVNSLYNLQNIPFAEHLKFCKSVFDNAINLRDEDYKTLFSIKDSHVKKYAIDLLINFKNDSLDNRSLVISTLEVLHENEFCLDNLDDAHKRRIIEFCQVYTRIKGRRVTPIDVTSIKVKSTGAGALYSLMNKLLPMNTEHPCRNDIPEILGLKFFNAQIANSLDSLYNTSIFTNNGLYRTISGDLKVFHQDFWRNLNNLLSEHNEETSIKFFQLAVKIFSLFSRFSGHEAGIVFRWINALKSSIILIPSLGDISSIYINVGNRASFLTAFESGRIERILAANPPPPYTQAANPPPPYTQAANPPPSIPSSSLFPAAAPPPSSPPPDRPYPPGMK